MAYWKFDEGSGSTAADSSGNGNNGTLVNGPVWTAGRVGNALYFDGIDDNVTVPDSASLHLSSAFTLSAWVNPAATFTDYRSIVTKNPPYYLYASSSWFCPDGSPLGGFSTDVINPVCQSSPLITNTWTNLAVTYNGSTLTLYRNGVAVANSNVSATLSPTTLNLQIGGSQFGEYFKGIIDEVRVYNKALSAAEIQTIYQQDSATPLQTVAAPVISPNGGNYSGSVPVTMQTETSGASIYYTTNGSSPSQSSTLYTGPITLANSATVKAKGFKTGSNASAEASASFTVTQPFNFSLANSGDKSVVAGSSVTNSISTGLLSGNAQAVTFSTSGLPTGATASFSSTSCSPACSSTLNINTTGSTPAGSSTITVTAAGGGVTKTTTFSLIVSLPTVATPAISPNGGNYSGSVSITMQTATSGALIYYTTNGSSPSQSSTLYTGPITVANSATVKAKAFESGYISSAESSASFTVATPLITAWTFCALENSPCSFSGTKEVRYGTNGVYVSQIFTNGVFCDNNVFGDPIFGWGKQCEYRDVSSPSTVATPAITPSGGNYNGSVSVTMQTPTSGASIYYTTDGSSPTPSSALYTGAITLTSNATVKAKAFESGYNASAEASASFTLATPLITAWTFCALENSPCSFSGTKEVRYGTNGVYVSQIFTNGVFCDNNVFGDPIFGWGKQCEYRDVSSQVTATTSTANASFGFSLANSGDKSVVAGSSVTNSISATLSSGNPQSAFFSVSGLPPGATGVFSSPSCNPTCSTVLTVNTNGSTPAGNFPITITSTGGSVTRTTIFTLSVTLALNVVTSPITSASGNGNTFYVATNGSDSNSGNFNQPFRTIQQGLSALKGGDNLFIRGGTYSADIFIHESNYPNLPGMANARTWIGAYNNENVTIVGSFRFQSSNGNMKYVTVDSLHIDGNRGSSGNGPISVGVEGGCPSCTGAQFIRFQNIDVYNAGDCAAAGVFVSSPNNEFINVKSHDNGPNMCDPVSGHLAPHGFYIGSGNNLFDRVEAYNNGMIGMQLYNASGAPSNNIVRNSYFHNNSRGANGCGLVVYGDNHQIYNNIFANEPISPSGGGGTGVAIGSWGNNVALYNNTVYGNQGDGLQLLGGGTGHVVKNNIVYSNGAQIVVYSGTTATYGNNLCGSPGTGCDIVGNPLFVDPANGNFELQSISPAINAGTSFIAANIASSTQDIGAY